METGNHETVRAFRRPTIGPRGAWILLLFGMGAAPSAAPAQDAPTDSIPLLAPSGEELTVYVMTMGPGPAVWERFGHNAIRVRDDLRGTDIAYNWGMFSLDQENFLLNFVRGRMEYWMEGFDASLMAAAYANADRSVWMQELDLSPAQRVELRDFLEWNARPENRFYLYDYYLDNCSTRVRDAIDLVLGGQLRASTETGGTDGTFRSHTRALTSEDPPLYAGLMLGLARPVDREITVWEEMFLPMRLMERIRDVSVVTESGETIPLVRNELVVYERSAPLPTPDPSPRWPTYTLSGLLIGGVVMLTGLRRARGRTGGGVFPWLAGVWAVAGGGFGLVILGLWVATDHLASHRNENLLQVNPLLLVLAVLIPLAARSGIWAGRAAKCAVVIAGLSVLGFVAQLLPSFVQSNGEIIGLALPINVAVAISLVWLARVGRGDGVAARVSDPSDGRPAAVA